MSWVSLYAPDDLGGAHFARLEVVLGACPCGTGLDRPCPLTGWDDAGPVPGATDLRVFRHLRSGAWMTLDADGGVVTGSAFLAAAER